MAKKTAKSIVDSDSLTKSILELKETEQRIEHLAGEYEKFKMAVDGASDHIVISDPDGIIVYANAAAETTTGFAIKEMIGNKSGKLWGGLMEKSFYEQMWHTIKTEKKPFKGFLKNKRKNGEIYEASISISPILDKNGDPLFFVGLERDVTVEKAVERAKTEFVSLASHQLRTPLTVIKWYSEILLNKTLGTLNEKQKEYLREIATGNERMISLVNDLLNLSRIEMGSMRVSPEPIDICALLTEVVRQDMPIAKKKNITLTVVCKQKIPKINLDKQLIDFVFQNLISNSLKYTGEGGKVSVSVEMEKEKAKVIVKDNGCGIPKNQQSRIFTKFFRAENAIKKDTEGTGLGLHIVKNIVEGFGGQIWFESGEDAGTTFYVLIPKKGMKNKEGKSVVS